MNYFLFFIFQNLILHSCFRNHNFSSILSRNLSSKNFIGNSAWFKDGADFYKFPQKKITSFSSLSRVYGCDEIEVCLKPWISCGISSKFSSCRHRRFQKLCPLSNRSRGFSGDMRAFFWSWRNCCRLSIQKGAWRNCPCVLEIGALVAGSFWWIFCCMSDSRIS